MTIDERGRRAADRLRRSVEVDLDTESALREVRAGGRRASRSWRRMTVVGAAAVVLLAMVVALTILTDRGEDAAPVTTTTVPDTTVPVPRTTLPDDATPEQLLEVMPAGPLDGKDSLRLPVLVSPQAGVVDGQTITALGRGYLPGERVGIVMCASEAGVEGVAACDLGTPTTQPIVVPEGDIVDTVPGSTVVSVCCDHVTYAEASADGTVQAEVVLRQQIDTPFTGPIDCASAAERCLVAIGAVSDYDRSGGSFINFASAPPFPQPVLAVDVTGPYTEGQAINVTASGLLYSRDVRLQLCWDLDCATFASGRVAADGTFAGQLSVASVFLSDVDVEVHCDGRCEIRLAGTGLREATSAPEPAPVTIAFATAHPPTSAVPSTEPSPTTPVTEPSPPTTPVAAEPTMPTG